MVLHAKPWLVEKHKYLPQQLRHISADVTEERRRVTYIKTFLQGKIVVALKFSWKPPSQTNGPILLYKIRFSKAISDKSQPESSSAAVSV